MYVNQACLITFLTKLDDEMNQFITSTPSALNYMIFWTFHAC